MPQGRLLAARLPRAGKSILGTTPFLPFLTSPGGKINAATTLPDSSSVVTGSSDGSVHLWRVDTVARSGGERFTGVTAQRQVEGGWGGRREEGGNFGEWVSAGRGSSHTLDAASQERRPGHASVAVSGVPGT